MATRARHPLHTRGISLVEALVALAIMSIGMLALVGVQSAMRLNSDLAKQRTEATRIASEDIERVRSFVSVSPVAGNPGVSFDEITSRTVDGYQPPGGIGNTTYRVIRTVTDDPSSALKVVTVQVQWQDRTDQLQTVTMDGAIGASDPTLTALLMVPHRQSALSRNQGRHISIPDGAIIDSLDPSRSHFTPPGSSGVVWYFNNLTGEMRVCPGMLTDISSCPLATLVTGTVRFHISTTQPTGADAEAPAGPLMPLASTPGALALANTIGTGPPSASCFTQTVDLSIVYYCAVSTTDPLGWGGQLNLVLGNGKAFGLNSATYKSCRYTTDLPSVDIADTPSNEADPNAEFTPNANHPRTYCLERPLNPNESSLVCRDKRVKVNLINQNFLVIRGDWTCPTEWNSNNVYVEAGDPLIRANTRQHQPAP